MKKIISKIFIAGFALFVLNNEVAFSQVLAVTDTSEASVNRIRNAIKANKEIVNYIEYSLVSRGLPKHLRNLSLLESGFSNSSVSSAGAVGIWQFMPDHANDHGLSQDDRSDIYKSTKTAVNSLARLHNKYKDWITVLAAYNCGEGNIAKAMAKAGSKNYEDYYIYLPDETTNSIRKYINACYATGELDQLLGKRVKRNVTKQVVVTKKTDESVLQEENSDPSLLKTQINAGYNLEIISDYLNVTVNDIYKWNPHITKSLGEDAEVNLYLPAAEMAVFEANKNKILRLSLLK